jgi:hypothetical protein
MQIKSKIERKFWTEVLLGLIPDAVIGIFVAQSTSTGFWGFAGTIVGLQILYIFLWIKNAIWLWVRFWISGRKSLVAHLYSYLRENRYPEPDTYISDADSYFASIADNNAFPCELRIKAAIERASLVIPAQLGLTHHTMRVNMAYEDAIERYKGAFVPKP